ncbi:MAG: cytochrome c [Myxococcales bacterium]|nr:cytochrome c [Myxococcales bacterium]
MTTRRDMTFAFILAMVVPLALGACRGQVSKDPPIVPIRNMYDQPRYDPQEASAFFEDGRTMRPPVEGTVAREMETSHELTEGRYANGNGWIAQIPAEAIRRAGGMERLVTRGHERYNIYCSACHGIAGDGEGAVSRRAVAGGAAAFKAPSLHDERLLHIPDGQLYATITNGVRNMPAYRHSVPLQDRWAIVAYVRALQVMQPAVAVAQQGTADGAPADPQPAEPAEAAGDDTENQEGAP